MILARHVLGFLAVEELPRIALDAILAGYDSPSLRQLAGTSEHDKEEANRLFAKSIRELGFQVPPASEAGLTLARNTAREVLSGAITPYDGAKLIWDRVYTRLPELKQLRLFVGLASEYEDDIKHRGEYDRQIIEECRSLVGQEMKKEI